MKPTTDLKTGKIDQRAVCFQRAARYYFGSSEQVFSVMRFLGLTAIVAIISGGSALAQDEPREDGLYFRVGAGVTSGGDWEQNFTYNPMVAFLVAPPTGQMLELGEGFTAGGALGFDYADGIRTELEYRYASAGIENVMDVGGFNAGATSPSNEDVNAHFVMANFFFDLYNDSPITPFIGGGVGGALVQNELGVNDAALAYQGRAGLSLALGGGASADLEYIYLRTNDLVYGPADDEFASSTSLVRADGDHYQSSSVMVSIRKPF